MKWSTATNWLVGNVQAGRAPDATDTLQFTNASVVNSTNDLLGTVARLETLAAQVRDSTEALTRALAAERARADHAESHRNSSAVSAERVSADILRSAMGKKDREVVEVEQPLYTLA